VSNYCNQTCSNIVAILYDTDIERTSSEYEKKSASSADTRIRKYQVCKLLSINADVGLVCMVQPMYILTF